MLFSRGHGSLELRAGSPSQPVAMQTAEYLAVQNPPVPARSATVRGECESESKAGKERRKLPVSATRPPQRTAEVTEQAEALLQ